MLNRSIATKVIALFSAFLLAFPPGVVTALAASKKTKIEHDSPKNYIPGFRIKLQAEVEDPMGVMLARCYFKTEGDDNFVFVDMPAAGNKFQATLPAPWVNSKAVEYLFLVVNGSKKVTRSELFKIKEKKTKEAKTWKEAGDVEEIRLDRIQEMAETYEIFKKQIIDKYAAKLPDWQEAFAKGNLDIKTELDKARAQLRGFYDRVVVTKVPPSLQYGMVAEGIYTPAEIAAAGGASGASAATGAVAGGTVGASGGGIGMGWILLGAAAVGGGAVAATSLGGSDGDGGTNVQDARPVDFVGTFSMRDPSRSDYSATVRFDNGGTGHISEISGGRRFNANIWWSFNTSTKVFAFGVRGGGSARGPVTGTTNKFTLNGRYANGQAANFVLTRQ